MTRDMMVLVVLCLCALLLTAANGIRDAGEACYTVNPGDNLFRIARRFGTTAEALQQTNALVGTIIHPGQVLCLETPSVASTLPAPSLATDTETGTNDSSGSQLLASTPTPADSTLQTSSSSTASNLQPATLAQFWSGQAEWVLDEYDTGLPVGESDTVYRGGNEYWSYLHASQRSAGVVDQCGDPVAFPGCVTLWKSNDGGRQFTLDPPVCLLPCESCPCDFQRDHMGLQQYPRVSIQPDQSYMVYEFGANVYLRSSTDGVNWSEAQHIPDTWIWNVEDYRPCNAAERIGDHPHIKSWLEFDCLAGGPPGIYIEGNWLYVFVGLGKAPGHMGCLVGNRHQDTEYMRPCAWNPLFGAELGYGPVDVLGPEANPHFDFRTISSADVVRVGNRYYMTYEGVRGPSNINVVDDQFGLGLARSTGFAIDGRWEKYPGNPIIMDLPGNVGVGHADLLIVGDTTYLYTATSPSTRGRYVLMRR